MSCYRLEPPYNPDHEDWVSLPFCRGCRDQIIPPTRPVEWNGWDWHSGCLPPGVAQGREEALRADIQRDDTRKDDEPCPL